MGSVSLKLNGSELIKKKLKTMTDIQFATSEQKIDIVTVPSDIKYSDDTGEPTPLIVRNARKEAIRL